MLVYRSCRLLGYDAVWTLSSAKEGTGVNELRDSDLNSFWQCVYFCGSLACVAVFCTLKSKHPIGVIFDLISYDSLVIKQRQNCGHSTIADHRNMNTH